MSEEDKTKLDVDLEKENADKMRKHLQKSYSELTQREKNDLSEDMVAILKEEKERLDQVRLSFLKLAKIFAKDPVSAQEEWKRQTKKYR